MAPDDATRSRRLDTLNAAQQLEPIPVDDHVVAAWALLPQRLKSASQRMEINDSWIAASAIANNWPLVTQDHGFLVNVPELTIIHV